MTWRQSSPQSSESLEVSSEVLELARLSLEALLLGLVPLPQEISSTPYSTTSLPKTLRELAKLNAFLSTPSSTYKITRSSEPYLLDMSTPSSPTHDGKTAIKDVPKSKFSDQVTSWWP